MKTRVISCLATLLAVWWCAPGHSENDSPPPASSADLWTPRLFAIPQSAKATPVVVGVWDTGVDLSLFRTAPERGIGLDAKGNRSDILLAPLGEAQSRWPQIKQSLQGAADRRVGLQTPLAEQFRQKLQTLDPAARQAFVADLGLASVYIHGTMVATAAVQGNPFARVFATLDQEEGSSGPPTLADVAAQVRTINRIVKAFQSAKARVVNISWGVTPLTYDNALEDSNTDAGTRRVLAMNLYNAHRDGLQRAIASAPEILFVAGVRGSDNPEDDAAFIPAALRLPNLIAVGAVNRTGEATDFSSFGSSVMVHANGYRIDSRIPGGDPIIFSGVSLACPQVTNLAAKLLALKPDLDVATLRALILDGAEQRSTADAKHQLRLLNPRKSLELARLSQP